MDLLMRLRDHGACANRGPDTWDLFVGPDQEPIWDRVSREQHAKAFCRRCPVITDCREYAITYREVGIWGGTSDEDRTAIRQSRTHHLNAKSQEKQERAKAAWALFEAGKVPAEIAYELKLSIPTVYGYLNSKKIADTLKAGSHEQAGTDSEAQTGASPTGS